MGHGLAGTGVTVFGSRIGITETGLPVLARTHIVVAIIGILAAVAVPGFMKYIKDSKTTEAKSNLKAIAEGASSFYQTEHTLSDGTVYTREFPMDRWQCL